MAQPSVTGPAHLYVTQPPGTIFYLGVSETTPDINYNPSFTPVPSDVAGGKKPHDWIYDGTDGDLFTGGLTVWNWSVLLAVLSRPFANFAAAPGALPTRFCADLPGDRGTLMLTEGAAYTLFVQFPYFQKSAWGGFMPGGFRFPFSWVFGPDKWTMGTRPNKIAIGFHMASKLQADGSWILCDGNMQGIPLVPPAAVA